jgi:hypothetical protein
VTLGDKCRIIKVVHWWGRMASPKVIEGTNDDRCVMMSFGLGIVDVRPSLT